MTEVYIVGVGMTPLGKHLDKSIKQLTAAAVEAALADAGCGVGQIDAAWFANTRQGIFEGQHGIRGQVALRPLGLSRVPIFNTDNACASSSAAMNMALAFLRSGMAGVALVVGAEKMHYPDMPQLMFEAFKGSWDRDLGPSHLAAVLDRSPKPPATDAAGSHSVFMDYYAAVTRDHMQRFGLTSTQLATVAAKNHNNSALNPGAYYRFRTSVEEVLADRVVSWPLTRAMCAPMTDGAAALVLARSDVLERFNRGRAVRIRASQLATGGDVGDGEPFLATKIAATTAYEEAGLGPRAVSLAEVHDATAFGEVIQSEHLDFCDIGDGGLLAQSGATALGGRIPINPSGGLLSKGHPIGATGALQIHELVTQLRGEAGARQVAGARIALAENGGGFYEGQEAIASVTILEATSK